MCQSTRTSGFYHAGPALEGTKCDENKVSRYLFRFVIVFILSLQLSSLVFFQWCSNGNCVQMKTGANFKIVKGGWSDWKNLGCKSTCMVKSKGYQKKTRTCTNPTPINTDEGCRGPSEDVQLCKDDKVFCQWLY